MVDKVLQKFFSPVGGCAPVKPSFGVRVGAHLSNSHSNVVDLVSMDYLLT